MDSEKINAEVISVSPDKVKIMIYNMDNWKTAEDKLKVGSYLEIKDENSLEKEKESILKYIGKSDYVCVLDINSEKLNSVQFASFIDKTFLESGTITFVIGSSLGIHEDIKKIANKKLSFSDMTFPHGLFRVMLLEQIYRAFKINNNETYHK